MSYLFAELTGAVFCALVFYGLDFFFDFGIKYAVMDTVSIALLNTAFRMVTAFALLPLIDKMADIICRLVKESEGERLANREFDRLDERFLEHPAVAVEQSRLTVNSMAETARLNLIDSMRLLDDYTPALFDKVQATEDLVDQFEDKLGTYLVKLTALELTVEQSERVSKYLHALSDFERISDHAVNISENAQEKNDKRVRFSADAEHELHVLNSAIEEILAMSIKSFIDDDIATAYRVEPLEERIDVLCDEMKLRHVDRLQRGECSLEHGFLFNDLLTNFERVADHCSNIAIALIELHAHEYDTHTYVINLKELHSHNFDALYAEYSERYRI